MKSNPLAPICTVPNRVERFYRGGHQIDMIRGLEAVDSTKPEDWVGSLTLASSSGNRPNSVEGLGRVDLGGGHRPLLSTLVQGDPLAFTGQNALNSPGLGGGLLVKLLDSAERLPVHAHPSRNFARRHFGSKYGKSEAWVILSVREDQTDPNVYIGMREEVPPHIYTKWLEHQDRDAIVGSLHQISVKAGDVLFIPGGIPHAIGPGLLIAEVQEPTDFSFVCEHRGYPLDVADAHLGLDLEGGIELLDLAQRSRSEIEAECFVASTDDKILHGACEDFFAGYAIKNNQEYSSGMLWIGICLDGKGTVSTYGGEVTVSRGDGFIVPASAGQWTVDGSARIVAFHGPALES